MLTREQQFVDDVFVDFGYGSDNVSYQNNDVYDPVSWIENNFYLYDTLNKIELYDCQRRPLVEALRKENGKFVYNTVLWSWPKKSAKSSVIAAVVEYTMANVRRASAKLVANDLKQADSRVGYYLRESIKHHPEYKNTWHIKPSGYLIESPEGSRCEMVPIDPNGEAGGNDSIIVYSELHGWKSTAHQKMWSEMTLSPNKFGQSQRWIDTYSGYAGESPILENLYQLGVKEGYRLWDDLEVYVNDSAKLLCVWVTEHLLPWQQGEDGRAYYAEQANTLTPNEFSRIHLNQWTSSESVFVPPEWWDACAVPVLPPLDKYKEIAVGIDAGVSDDCFGIVAVSRDHDKAVVRFSRKWTPPPGGKLQYSDPENKDNTEYPEGVLRWLAKTFNVIVFGFDEYQLHHLCNGLRADGVGLFEPFNQGGDRLEADKQLYDVIRDRRVIHNGDADLTEHVKNANQKADPESRRLRIVKRSHKMKIDLAVCLSTATHLAFRYLPE